MKNVCFCSILTFFVFTGPSAFASEIVLDAEALRLEFDANTVSELPNGYQSAPDVEHGTQMKLFSHNVASGEGAERYNALNTRSKLLGIASAFCTSLGHGIANDYVAAPSADTYLIELSVRRKISYFPAYKSENVFTKKLRPGQLYTNQMHEMSPFRSRNNNDSLLFEQRLTPHYFSSITCTAAAGGGED